MSAGRLALPLGMLLAWSSFGLAGDNSDFSRHRGRAGWRGPVEEWYWLFGNPRRIGPGFFFGDDPFMDAALRAHPETLDHLYKSPPRVLEYQKGSRPVLEEVVREVTRGGTTAGQRADALVRWVHALRVDPKGVKGGFRPRLPKELPADPHAPEQVIRKGGGSCEWVSRLFLSLLQVADIPGRLVIRRVHTQVEAYVNGSWVLYCPLMGDRGEAFLGKPAGKFAGKSAWQIYDPKDSKQEFAVAYHYLGEEKKVAWWKAPPKTKDNPPAPFPAAKPQLAISFDDGTLTLQPVEQPGPPEPLHMVPPKWRVQEGRARVDFAPGLFFHLNQAVIGQDDWTDVGVAATLRRAPHAQQGSAGVAGIVFRARGQNYNAVLLQDEQAVLVVRLEDGWKTRVLARYPWPLPRNGPVTLYVRCQGETVQVWLDGRYLGSVRQGLWPAGRVGLAAVQTASFDDVQVWLKPPAPPPPVAAKGVYTTEEIRLANVLIWDRLLLDVPLPARECQSEYSTDGGRTWHPVAEDHYLHAADPRSGRLRLRLKLPADSGPVRLGVQYRTSNNLKLAMP